jgi:hypothetical protein
MNFDEKLKLLNEAIKDCETDLDLLVDREQIHDLAQSISGDPLQTATALLRALAERDDEKKRADTSLPGYCRLVDERDAATKRADGLRTDLAAAQAKLAEAVQLLSYCRPRVQSYEECNETYCADGQDHEIRKRIEAFLAAAEQGGA